MAKRSAPVARPVVLGLLQAIRSNFADDSPRLILADWLDENGDPDRAEYLRLDVQMRWMSETDPAAVALGKRAKELEDANSEKWREVLKKTVGSSWFYRGLIHVGVPYADALDPRFDRLIDTEELAWVGLVQLQGDVDLEKLPELLARPWLGKVAGVALDNIGLRKPAVEVLAASPVFAGMSRLDLETNRLSSASLRMLLGSPHLSNLTYLDLSHNPFGDVGAKVVATSAVMSRLVWLFLEDCNIGDRGARALARVPVGRPYHLDLEENKLGDEGVRALTRTPFLSQCRRLHLRRNSIGNGGAAALANCPHLTSLVDLRLGQNEIGNRGATALAASSYLTALRNLDLSSNHIQGPGASAFTQPGRVGTLLSLDLDGNRISKKMQAALRKRFGEQMKF